METSTTKKSFPAEQVFMSIIEYGIYLFVLLMFAGKFGTFRELGIFLPSSLWLLGCLIKKQCYLQWKEPLFLIIISLFLSALISSILSPDPLSSLSFFKKEYLKIMLLYIVISTTFSRGNKLQKLSFFLAMTGVLYLFLGGYKILTDLLYSNSIHYDETRNYATIFLFFLPFVILQNINGNNVQNVLWKIPTIGMVLGIFIIGVRGSWLGLAGVFSVWAFFLRNKFKNNLRILKGIIPIVIVVFVIIMVFLIFPAQYSLIKKHISNNIQISLRFEAWDTFLKMSEERFLFGHGLDDKEMSAYYREFYKNTKGVYPSEEKPTTPHNQFIKILYQQGITGLITYILLFLILVYRTIKKFYINNLMKSSFIGIAIISVVIGEYVIRCMSEDRSLVPLGILAGMAGAFLRKDDKVKGIE